MDNEDNPEFWEYRRLVEKNQQNSVGGFGPPLQGLSKSEQARYQTLENKFDRGGWNAPPGHWTSAEIEAANRANDRFIGCAGLVAIVVIGAAYVHDFGWTLKPIIDYFSK